MMNYYFAPLEGITGCLFRQVHHGCFPQINKYFMPFLVPHEKRVFSSKELRETAPENNQGITAVPQIMTCRAEDFISTARKLKDLGYDEVNLNLGCPSKTVVHKKRGSGFLAYPQEIDHFLSEIFAALDMKISVKTRIGVEDPEEFPALLEIYNRYPLEELIVHPRLQQDYYSKPVHMDVFRKCAADSKNSLCYNGDLVSKAGILSFQKEFPQIDRVMIGRGLLRNPGLVQEMTEGRELDAAQLRDYHDRIYQACRETLSGDRNILFRMKELWGFMGDLFPDGKKSLKRIKKSQKCADYERAVEELFASGNFSLQEV